MINQSCISMGTTAERPSSPSTDLLYLNTDLNTFEKYSGSTWVQAIPSWPPQGFRLATTTPVTVATSDYIVGVKLGSPGASTVNLPAGIEEQQLIIKDALGDSDTNNITINAHAGDTFEGGGTTITINFPFGSITFIFHSGVWYPVGFT